MEVKGFGFFPQAQRPRVFWAGVAAPPALAELAARVESHMEKIGFAREDRAFSPHLTLARFQVPRPQPALEAAVAGRATASLGKFEASEFFLFESKLSPQGAQYRKVMRFPQKLKADIRKSKFAASFEFRVSIFSCNEVDTEKP